MKIVVVNPLGVMLAHYQRELGDSLKNAEVTTEFHMLTEPSHSSSGRLRWALTYYAKIIRLRMRLRGEYHLICLWPIIGAFDSMILGLLFGRRASLIIHDPVPLVRAIGYNRRLWAISQRLKGPEVLVHSDLAAQDASAQGIHSHQMLPHPILASGDHATKSAPPVVLVAGQYKRDRDLGLLASLAPHLSADCQLKVVGSGWPKIEGWHVESRFLAEDELDSELASAAVVLIPYRRFYQSGIAVRSIELGTPVVGPLGSSVSDMVACAPSLIPQDGTMGWVSSIRAAVEMDREVIDSIISEYVDDTRGKWEGYVSCLRSRR